MSGGAAATVCCWVVVVVDANEDEEEDVGFSHGYSFKLGDCGDSIGDDICSAARRRVQRVRLLRSLFLDNEATYGVAVEPSIPTDGALVVQGAQR
jgi:hypothetical protein